MLKFNFSNLNNKFKSALLPKESPSEPPQAAPETAIMRSKPRYSAYRTVVMRHEEFSARLSCAGSDAAAELDEVSENMQD